MGVDVWVLARPLSYHEQGRALDQTANCIWQMAHGRWHMANGRESLADEGADPVAVFGMGVGGEGTGPGDVAVAGGVEVIVAFAEDPAGSDVTFAQGEIVRGDVLLGFGEAFLGGGELVHETKAEVVFFAGKID